MKPITNPLQLMLIKMNLFIYKNFRMGRNKKVSLQINQIVLTHQVKIPTYLVSIATNQIGIMIQMSNR